MLQVGFHPISPTEGEPQAAVVTFGTEGYPDAIWRVASHALAAAPGTAIVVPHRSHGCEKRKKVILEGELREQRSLRRKGYGARNGMFGPRPARYFPLRKIDAVRDLQRTLPAEMTR